MGRAGAVVLLSFSVLFFALTPAKEAHSQENDDGRQWVGPQNGEIDDRALRSGERLVLEAQLTSTDPIFREQAIDRLVDLARSDRLSGYDPSLLDILEFVLLEPHTREYRGRGGPASVYSRVQVVEVLRSVGGPNAITLIVSMLQLETDPVVLTEGLRALRSLDVYPDDEVLRALRRVIYYLRDVRPDEGLMLNAVGTVEYLDGIGWGIEDADLFRGMIDLLEGPYSSRARRAVLASLDRIRR